jgi:acyl dehydratase
MYLEVDRVYTMRTKTLVKKVMSKQQISIEELTQKSGEIIGVSEWFSIDQSRINDFGSCTDDHQWIHVDPARCETESPYKTTIAHGFLSLSLLSPIHLNASYMPIGTKQVINYGLDAIRFISPVKCGARVRGHIQLLEVKPRGRTRYFIKTLNTIEIENEKKPALTAELITLITI